LTNPFIELDFHYAAGWRVDSLLENENSAVVVLGNLGISATTITQLGDIVLDSASNNYFDNVSVGFLLLST